MLFRSRHSIKLWFQAWLHAPSSAGANHGDSIFSSNIRCKLLGETVPERAVMSGCFPPPRRVVQAFGAAESNNSVIPSGPGSTLRSGWWRVDRQFRVPLQGLSGPAVSGHVRDCACPYPVLCCSCRCPLPRVHPTWSHTVFHARHRHIPRDRKSTRLNSSHSSVSRMPSSA